MIGNFTIKLNTIFFYLHNPTANILTQPNLILPNLEELTISKVEPYDFNNLSTLTKLTITCSIDNDNLNSILEKLPSLKELGEITLYSDTININNSYCKSLKNLILKGC